MGDIERERVNKTHHAKSIVFGTESGHGAYRLFLQIVIPWIVKVTCETVKASSKSVVSGKALCARREDATTVLTLVRTCAVVVGSRLTFAQLDRIKICIAIDGQVLDLINT